MTDPSSEPAAVSRLAALDTALARIASGEPADRVRHSLVPDSWRPVLARVAVAGRLDQQLYDQLLTPADSGDPPVLAVLADTGFIAPIPGRPGWFSMADEDRTAWAAELPDDERIRLSAELAEAHLSHGDRLEGMQHLLTGDPERGRRLLETLLDEADDELNLPRCGDILRAASESTGSTGGALADFIADRTAYLNARSSWLPDYYQSAHFLEPDGLARRGAGFAAGRAPRVWHLTGRGGAGKSMQLRWLASRHWVPRPARLAVARVDFDSADPVACARYPFLVFLMAASQLARQLPRNPFSHLLRSYEPFLALAWPQADRDLPLDPAQAARAAHEVPRLFASGCRAAERPVIVILDTLEELSLRYPAETAELVRRFFQVGTAAPELRLVFAGRYEIPAVRRRFPNAIVQPVAPFSEAQAERYLSVTRGIGDPGRRGELIRRADGLPFLLAMYADLVTGDPGIALDDLGKDVEPRLVYLAGRIIDRIPQPLVRWLLRYGWIPRRLTRGYVRDVLAPFLVQAGAGDRSLDDPLLDPITEWRGRRLFPTDLPDLQERLEQAWTDLIGYASESSWVMTVADDPGTLVFKAELLAPMRSVLARQAVLRELHVRSADYYRRQAAANPARRSRFLREAVYHLAQGGAPDLLPRWRGFVDEARESGDYAALADLCVEVTGPEYLAEDGTPLRREGRDIVPAELAAEAHLWRAYAAQAQLVGRLRDGVFPDWRTDPLWADARRELDAVRWNRSAWTAGRALLLARAGRLIRAALALPDDALVTWHGAGALSDAEDDIGFCANALRVVAALLTGQDPVPPLRDLVSRGLRAERPAEVAPVAEALAKRLSSRGDLPGAISLVERVNPETGSLTGVHVALLTEQGTPGGAGGGGPAAGESLDVDWCLARAYLALRQPEKALELVRAAGRRLEGRAADPTARLRERAAYLNMLGVVSGTLLRIEEASAAFQESASLWRELGQPDGHQRSNWDYAEFLLHEMGDVSGALRELDVVSLSFGTVLEYDEQWAYTAEAAAATRLMTEALGRQPSRPQRPGAIAGQLIDAAGPDRHRVRALAAVAALVATQDVARYGPVLVDSVARIEPPSARLKALDGLRWSPPLPPHEVLATLDRVADEACVLIRADTREDAAVHYLQRAYVARACHMPEAAPALASAVNLAGPSFLACEVLRNFPDDAPASAAVLAEEYLRAGDRPVEQTLAAMVHVRLAERLLHRGEPAPEIDQLLQRADEELRGAARRSRWRAEYLELLGVVARTRGQTGEARIQFEYAQSLRERLGDVIALRALDAQLESMAEPGSAASSMTNAERALIAASLPGGDEIVVRALARHNSGDTRTAMAWSVESARFGTVPEAQDGVVRVESSGPELLALPWELVAQRVYRAQPPAGTAERDIAWLRWALRAHSATFGPEARQFGRQVIDSGEVLTPSLRWEVERALRGVSRRRKPRVVIVKGSERAESSWGYSSRSRGLNLESSYRSAGWDVTVYTAARFKGVTPLGSSSPTDVLHLSARMEVSGTLSWLDTSEEELGRRSVAKSSGTDTGIFATDVVRWLGWLARGGLARGDGEVGPPPVVVLDPVIADLVTEPERFLAGRNQFASQLYLDGMTMAVVATGLAGSGALAVQQAWLDGVAHDEPLEEVIRAVRAAAPPAMPPALFAPSRSYKISVS